MKKNRIEKLILFSASIAFLVGLWWVLSVTAFSHTPAVPAPPPVFGYLGRMAGTSAFWKNIWNTLSLALPAFGISFLVALITAVAASQSKRLQLFITPIITVIRALPTIGLVLVLFMVFRRPQTGAAVIGIMMAYPVLHEGFLTAIQQVDKKLLEMARAFKVPVRRQLLGIYVPHCMPFVFGGAVIGMGMTLKVVIAAEIISIPFANTIGTALQAANINAQFGLMFMWLVVAVLVSFALELIIKLLGKACMPWRRGEK